MERRSVLFRFWRKFFNIHRKFYLMQFLNGLLMFWFYSVRQALVINYQILFVWHYSNWNLSKCFLPIDFPASCRKARLNCCVIETCLCLVSFYHCKSLWFVNTEKETLNFYTFSTIRIETFLEAFYPKISQYPVAKQDWIVAMLFKHVCVSFCFITVKDWGLRTLRKKL